MLPCMRTDPYSAQIEAELKRDLILEVQDGTDFIDELREVYDVLFRYRQFLEGDELLYKEFKELSKRRMSERDR